ncbi:MULTISPECIES: hypothetical protein [unclassified Sphingomonas]|uniref:hypothetical protein n=1 Tax=unclassified Sphingomonas TaxID=196159 RepID=UPI000BDB7E1C|nr:MAG: hypothetical protein B7Y98_06000 [Sphingomonas sp. 32-62-10]
MSTPTFTTLATSLFALMLAVPAAAEEAKSTPTAKPSTATAATVNRAKPPRHAKQQRKRHEHERNERHHERSEGQTDDRLGSDNDDRD